MRIGLARREICTSWPRFAAGWLPLLLAVFALCVAPRAAVALTFRFSDPAHLDGAAPDPLHIADRADGIAFARCVRRDSVLPALFRLERSLGGDLPDSFTVRADGWYVEGERCVLVLKRPPACLASVPSRYRRYVEDFDAITAPQITGEYPSVSTMRTDDERVVEMGEGLWRAGRQPTSELRRRIKLWLIPRDYSFAPSPGTEALLRHPELRDAEMEALLLDRVHGPASWWGRERAARALGMRPDSLIRAAARALYAGGVDDRCIATLLVARDTLVESRTWLLASARDSDDLVAEFALRALQPAREDERALLIRCALDNETLVRDLTHRLQANPDSVASLMETPNYLRVVALQCLGSDTARVVRSAIARILRENSYEFAWPPDTSGVSEVTTDAEGDSTGDTDLCCDDPGRPTLNATSLASCWTGPELLEAIRDPSAPIRDLAYREVARRKDRSAARIVLEHLRARRLADGTLPDLDEFAAMIHAIGATGDPIALPELIRLAAPPDTIGSFDAFRIRLHLAACSELRNFNDPRALGALRALVAFAERDTLWRDWWNYVSAVPRALSAHGGPADVAFYRGLIRRSPDLLLPAIAGIASVAGPAALFEFLARDPQGHIGDAAGLRIGAWIGRTCGREGDRAVPDGFWSYFP